MLTPDELVALRTDMLDTLPDTCQVQRVTLTDDGMGGHAKSWKTVATVCCRVAPAGGSPQERVIAERLTAVSAWTLTLPAATNVRPTDRLLVGGRTFEVAGVLARSEELARRVVCTEVL